MTTKYRLEVTAGPGYDYSQHRVVRVNGDETLTVESEHMTVGLAVRIRDYKGLPDGSPSSSPYFDHPLHIYDQYSIALSLIPRSAISGSDLVFGNDFDRPVRDRLPPGFNTAFRIVKWMIDPGLDGDVYADNPYLYGPALSSFNILHIGDKVSDDGSPQPSSSSDTPVPNPSEGREAEEPSPDEDHTTSPLSTLHSTVITEGATGTGASLRSSLSIPSDPAARKKFFLDPSHLASFTFEPGRLYQSDFGNPYLCFNDFSLKLPGFHLDVIRYVDEKTHELRYTLKNRGSGVAYLCVVFRLLWGGELKEEERPEGEEDDDEEGGDSDDFADAEEGEEKKKRKEETSKEDEKGGTGGDTWKEPEPSEEDVD